MGSALCISCRQGRAVAPALGRWLFYSRQRQPASRFRRWPCPAAALPSTWKYLPLERPPVTDLWQTLYLELSFLAGILLTAGTIAWVLMTKKDATSALAWCLLIFFLPLLGPLFFLVFGYQH